MICQEGHRSIVRKNEPKEISFSRMSAVRSEVNIWTVRNKSSGEHVPNDKRHFKIQMHGLSTFALSNSHRLLDLGCHCELGGCNTALLRSKTEHGVP